MLPNLIKLGNQEDMQQAHIFQICLLKFEISLQIVYKWKELCSTVQFLELYSGEGI
jgi:hypothetical protein